MKTSSAAQFDPKTKIKQEGFQLTKSDPPIPIFTTSVIDLPV